MIINFFHFRWFFYLVLIIGACLLAIISEKIILVKLKRIAQRTKWQGDDIILAALSGKTFLWCTLIVTFGLIRILPLTPVLKLFFHKSFIILLISIFILILSRMTADFIHLYTQKIEGILPSASIFGNLSRIFIFIIGLLIILQYLGISITPVLTALGVGGLAVALALQDTLSNLFAGLNIIISKQIKTGDYIKLDMGEEGYVMDITWRNTTIKQLPNNMVVIPNNKLSSAIITNFYLPDKKLFVRVPFGVSYHSDLEKVEKITIEVAKDVLKIIPGGVVTIDPMVQFHTFEESSIQGHVIICVKEVLNQYQLKHELIKQLHKRYRKEGIEIPFPTRTIHYTDKCCK